MRLVCIALFAAACFAQQTETKPDAPPLLPPVPSTLALIEHRNKPNEPALEIVRNALLALHAGDEPKSAGRTTRGGARKGQRAKQRSRPGKRGRPPQTKAIDRAASGR